MIGLDSIKSAVEGLFSGCGTTPADHGASTRAATQTEDPQTTKTKHAHLSLLRGVEACTDARPVDAIALFQEAFITFRECGEREKASLVQKVITLLFGQIDDEREVRRAIKKARSLLEQAGFRDEVVRVLLYAGSYEVGHRAYPDGFSHFRAAITMSHAIDRADLEIEACCRYAQAEMTRGRTAEAKKLLEQASAAAEKAEDLDLRTAVTQRSAEILR